MAWTKSTVGDYTLLTETGLVLDDNESGSAEIVTVTSAIPPGMDWENKKWVLNVDMTTAAGAAVVVDGILQTSNTGTTSDDVMGASSATPSWIDAAAIDIDIAAGGTANHAKEVDASSLYAPYARIALKTAATDLTDDAGRCTIVLAFKNDGSESNVSMVSSDFTGVGADPS